MLERGVDCLRHPHQHNGNHDPAPTACGDVQRKSCDDHAKSRKQMQPRIVLRAQHVSDAGEGVLKALQPRQNRKAHQ
jgi:hypothetical protein